MADLAERVGAQGGNVNRILSDAHAEAGDVHQLNCTYYSALGGDDERYLAARAIQLFARGVPQIYYVGLLAGANDHAAVERTGEGRAINRHDYTRARSTAALQLDRSCRRWSTSSGCATRTRHSTAISWSTLTTTIRFDSDGGQRTPLILDVDFEDGTAVVTDHDRAESLFQWVTSVGPTAVLMTRAGIDRILRSGRPRYRPGCGLRSMSVRDADDLSARVATSA